MNINLKKKLKVCLIMIMEFYIGRYIGGASYKNKIAGCKDSKGYYVIMN